MIMKFCLFADYSTLSELGWKDERIVGWVLSANDNYREEGCLRMLSDAPAVGQHRPTPCNLRLLPAHFAPLDQYGSRSEFEGVLWIVELNKILAKKDVCIQACFRVSKSAQGPDIGNHFEIAFHSSISLIFNRQIMAGRMHDKMRIKYFPQKMP